MRVRKVMGNGSPTGPSEAHMTNACGRRAASSTTWTSASTPSRCRTAFLAGAKTSLLATPGAQCMTAPAVTRLGAVDRSAAAARGDHAEALSRAWRVVSAIDSGRGDGVRWTWSVAADAALELGDLDAVQRAVDWLDALPPGHVEPLLRAERLRINARQLAQRQDPAAADAFARAVVALRAVGSPYHLALGLMHHAEHLTADDPAAAAPLAAEVGEIARRLGAPWLERRADQLEKVSALTR